MAARRPTADKRPTQVTLRSYDVGFGDCYMLSFHYPSFDRHLLIDFGSTRLPESKAGRKNYMTDVAKQIAVDCGGRLHAVIATHRHKDHISGFATNAKGDGPGDIIRGLRPSVVIQPWTEDPRAERDARKPSKALSEGRKRVAEHVRMLKDMNAFAGHVKRAAAQLKGSHLKKAREQLEFLGDDNELKNRSAVENLMTMARNRYVYFESRSGLEALLPGVSVSVLGPPTLAQDSRIETQRSYDANEFWHLQGVRQSFWAKRERVSEMNSDQAESLFPNHVVKRKSWDMRWYTYQAQAEHADNLLSLVRTLDKAMNNTSVILLFELGDKSLLFPGDAQYENWMHALSKPKIVQRLAKVNVYKVGHHGSLNATPRSLWGAFGRKGGVRTKDRLLSYLSTRSHVHGTAEGSTEVPRSTLVKELVSRSLLHDTREFGDSLRSETTLDIKWK